MSHRDFSECDDVTDDRPLVQGDVFEWLNRGSDPWQHFGIVVTANCDIAEGKHRGILSYVPLLSLEDYLRLFFLPKALRKGVKSIAEELGKKLLDQELAEVIRAHQAANLPEFPEPLSDKAALQWASTMKPEALADELRITEPNPRAKFIALVPGLPMSMRQCRAKAMLSRWKPWRRNPSPPRCRPCKGGRKDLGGDSRHNSEPSGRFLLCRSGAFGFMPSAGWVAYLRLVREIQHDSVAIRQPDLRKPGTLAKRVVAITLALYL